MKVLILFFFCVYSVLYVEPVGGDLVPNLFGAVHNTASRVRSDLSKVFNPNTNRGLYANNAGTGENKEVEAEERQNNNMNSDIIKFVDEEDEATTKESPAPSKTTLESTKAPSTTTKTTSVPTATTAPSQATNGTDKDGRENFAAQCSSGYKSTRDGRCMKVE